MKVLRGVRKEHLDRGITTPPLTLAARRLQEMNRQYAKWIGPENLAPQRKATLTHELIERITSTEVEGAKVCFRKGRAAARHRAATVDADGAPSNGAPPASGAAWTWQTAFGRSCKTLFHVLAQTGFRKAEVALGDEPWGLEHVSWDNLYWVIGGCKIKCPSARQLAQLQAGDYVVFRPPASKTDPLGQKWMNHPIYLPYDERAPLNAARELRTWELEARVPPERRRTTPLFCGPDGVGTPLTQDTIDDVFHGLLTFVLGSRADAMKYSIHSFRSYLCSALFAAKCSDAEIMACLRWSTTESLEIYKNVDPARYGGWLLSAERQRIGGMRLVNLATEFGRPLPVTDSIARAHMISSGRQATLQAAELGDQDVGSHHSAVTLDGRAEPPPRPMPLPSGPFAPPPGGARGQGH